MESATLQGQEYEDDAADPLSNFLYALRAPETKRQYPRRLKVLLDYLGLDGDLKDQAKAFLSKVRSNPQWVQNSLIQFISAQKERVALGQISPGTITNYYKATKLFIEMNTDTPIINWKRISRGLPRGRKAANDRAPTLEELRKLSEYPDRRIKPIIYVMASSGIRLGAWDYLQWKHVSPIKNDKNEIIAAKLQIYPGDPEEYFCFIVPVAYNSLLDWMNYRVKHGEKISDDSWLMRDLWQTTDIKYGAMFGVATYPKRLKSSGIKSLLERAIKGISISAHKADLLDRLLNLKLKHIDKRKRKKLKQLQKEFERILPYLLGYIFDLLVKVLARMGEIKLEELPRMADFAELGELISRRLGYPDGKL